MVFPAGLGAHSTLMRFFEYSYGGAAGSVRKHIKDIVLPLPRQLSDSLKVNVGGDEQGIIGNASAQAAANAGDLEKIAKQLGGATVKAIAGIGKDIAKGDYASALGLGADAGQFLVRAGLGTVAPDIANGISAGRGTAINPFATLVFKGVDLKAHTLEWIVSPESESESRTLKEIIRHIQNMILPKVDSAFGKSTGITAIDRGILRYPAMVDVYFQGIDMNYYYKFKTSMISQFSVDYAPNGLAINRGGRPSVMRIEMTLQEAYIHTKEDYDLNDIKTEATKEKTIEEKIQNQIFDGVISSFDSVDVNGNGANNGALGNNVSVNDSLSPGETVVNTSDAQSLAKAPTSAGLADEYLIGNNVYTQKQLFSVGITKEMILANPSKFKPLQTA